MGSNSSGYDVVVKLHEAPGRVSSSMKLQQAAAAAAPGPPGCCRSSPSSPSSSYLQTQNQSRSLGVASSEIVQLHHHRHHHHLHGSLSLQDDDDPESLMPSEFNKQLVSKTTSFHIPESGTFPLALAPGTYFHRRPTMKISILYNPITSELIFQEIAPPFLEPCMDSNKMHAKDTFIANGLFKLRLFCFKQFDRWRRRRRRRRFSFCLHGSSPKLADHALHLLLWVLVIRIWFLLLWVVGGWVRAFFLSFLCVCVCARARAQWMISCRSRRHANHTMRVRILSAWRIWEMSWRSSSGICILIQWVSPCRLVLALLLLLLLLLLLFFLLSWRRELSQQLSLDR